ncbi:hypothetical protein ACHAW6_009500 [Cyclotella cf. meneghiniana]
MMKIYLVDKEQCKSGSSKRPPILTEEMLNKQNEKALRNESCANLRDCNGCIFCTIWENLRKKTPLKHLCWMQSKLAMHVDLPNLEDLDSISLCLEKIPEDYEVVEMKGFQVLNGLCQIVMMQIHRWAC